MGGMRRAIECISITDDDKHAYCGTRTGDVLKFKIDRDDIRVRINTYGSECDVFDIIRTAHGSIGSVVALFLLRHLVLL